MAKIIIDLKGSKSEDDEYTVEYQVFNITNTDPPWVVEITTTFSKMFDELLEQALPGLTDDE